VIFSSEASRR